MIKIYFKNVGQGDSIILEWTDENKKCIGVIDCNLVQNRNPIIDHLQSANVTEIDFIILSHLHDDHFSGMADLFNYCMNNNIKVKYFYHSISPFILEIYNRIFTSQKIGKSLRLFFETYEKFGDYVTDTIQTTIHLSPIKLNNSISLSFLSPSGGIYDKMQKQISRKTNRITTTSADINKLSTVIQIINESKGESILLTSDAVVKVFKKITITGKIVLAQIPHHGSKLNLEESFWKNLNRIDNCPAIFSVGDEPKDKLPDEETVYFFDKSGYDIFSTNNVYGISNYFNSKSNTTQVYPKSTLLNSFSTHLKSSQIKSGANPKFNGEQIFTCL